MGPVTSRRAALGLPTVSREEDREPRACPAFVPRAKCLLQLLGALLTHGGRHFRRSTRDSKTNAGFFFLFRSFTDGRFILTIDLSDLGILLFVCFLSLLSQELSPFTSRKQFTASLWHIRMAVITTLAPK